jgi:hypothetical protein
MDISRLMEVYFGKGQPQPVNFYGLEIIWAVKDGVITFTVNNPNSVSYTTISVESFIEDYFVVDFIKLFDLDITLGNFFNNNVEINYSEFNSGMTFLDSVEVRLNKFDKDALTKNCSKEFVFMSDDFSKITMSSKLRNIEAEGEGLYLHVNLDILSVEEDSELFSTDTFRDNDDFWDWFDDAKYDIFNEAISLLLSKPTVIDQNFMFVTIAVYRFFNKL